MIASYKNRVQRDQSEKNGTHILLYLEKCNKEEIMIKLFPKEATHIHKLTLCLIRVWSSLET